MLANLSQISPWSELMANWPHPFADDWSHPLVDRFDRHLRKEPTKDLIQPQVDRGVETRDRISGRPLQTGTFGLGHAPGAAWGLQDTSSNENIQSIPERNLEEDGKSVSSNNTDLSIQQYKSVSSDERAAAEPAVRQIPREGSRPNRLRSTSTDDNFGRALSQRSPRARTQFEAELEAELDSKWILNLSMHFRDKSDRERFFVTYAETLTLWRRVTVSCDYRNAEPGSLDMDLKELRYQRDKSAQIYESIRDSLPEIQFYNTVTNLKLETSEERLHVHVTEDTNEITPYPLKTSLEHMLESEIPWDDRVRGAQQVVQGLSDIHQEGYVQGDFTLSNIVVDSEDNSKIIDINRRGCPVGWEPPEIAKKIQSSHGIPRYVGEKCDVYQLSMIFRAMGTDDGESERHYKSLRAAKTGSKMQRLKRVLPMIINGSRYSTTPDTGSLDNMISAVEAHRLGIKISGKRRQFWMGNGSKLTSLGTVRLKCSFARGDPQRTRQTFNVIRNLAVPVIMGRIFLDISKTLTLHQHRLESVWIAAKKALRVMHLNRPKQLMCCYVDGSLVYANADTGSEMDLMSPSYALSNSLNIEPLEKHERWVRLANGRKAKLLGKVNASFDAYDALYGSPTERKKHARMFYLMDGLTSDVLLGEEALYDINAFTEHEDSFVELSDSNVCSDLNLITWFDKREQFLSDALGVFSSTSARQMREDELQKLLSRLDARELHQREVANEKIEYLPVADRPAQRVIEHRRRQDYDAGRARLRQERNAASNASMQNQATTAATTTSYTWRDWLRRRT